MAAVDDEFRQLVVKFRQQSVRQNDIPRIYSLLCRAHPLTDKPPYFPIKDYRQITLGRQQFWPIAKMLPLAAKLYEAAYSPPPGSPLIFKEVNFVKPIQNILERTSVPVVYLVRHPCATVLSQVHGQLQGKMPARRQSRLRELLLMEAPALAERFADILAGSDVMQKAALRWRYEIESCVPVVRASANGMLLTYEQLADDARTHVKAMFTHFCLGYSEQTDRFIEMLYALKPAGKTGPRRTGWGDKFYSVYRNPAETKDSWKQKISSEDRRKVEAIVEDSDAVACCAALGHW
jgi:hypothetical protein